MKLIVGLLAVGLFVAGLYYLIKDAKKTFGKKKNNNISIFILLISMFATSCASVDAGHKGVEVSWGGKTNMDMIYNEGLSNGIHWIWDDMVQYDCRERTLVERYEFNDKASMLTTVEIALDFSLDPTKVNVIHTQIKDYEIKIAKTLKSAAKEVVPQYTAVELNLEKRMEAESKLSEILTHELPEFFVRFGRIQITDVDLPSTISQLAEETAKQIERNKLAEKKEAEKIALAKAQVAESQGNYESALYDAKTKDILSQPKMLELYRLETERIQAEGFLKHGKSWFGENNVFGSETAIIKGLK